jgi:calcium permeable stress-gated cation channel
VVHQRIRDPVVKLAKEVQKNVAKTANIDPNLKTVDLDNENPVRGKDMKAVKDRDLELERDEKPHASTSAHAVSGAVLNEELPRPMSQRTKSARRLHIPTEANGETEDNQRFPDFAPPTRREVDDGAVVHVENEEEEDKDFDTHGFDHPSTYEPQHWIWLPKDPLGLSRVLLGELHGAGVEASDEGAEMDEKGNVEVYRGPPDQDWSGGHDA